MKKILFVICLLLTSWVKGQNFEWAVSFGSINPDNANEVKTDIEGNCYTIGEFSYSADFDPGPGVFTLSSTANSDGFIQKLDSAGNFIWAKQIGGSALSTSARAEGFVINELGELIIVGNFVGSVDFDPSPGLHVVTTAAGAGNSAFILKLDENGDFIWVKEIKRGSVYEVSVDESESIIVSGIFNDSCEVDPGPALYNLYSVGSIDCFLLKLDSEGDFIWAKSFGSTLSDKLSINYTDENNNIYIAGTVGGFADLDPDTGTFFYTPMLSGDIGLFVSKFDSSGSLIWTKVVNCSGPVIDLISDLRVDYVGNVIMTGSFSGFADFDPGPGFIGINTTGSYDVFFLKLSSSGNILWVKTIGSSGSDVAKRLGLDAIGNIYAGGYFQGTVDFDPGFGVYNLSASTEDAYLLKLDSAGNFVWAKNFSGPSIDRIYDVYVDPSTNIYLSGGFQATTDFDPGIPVFPLSSNGSYDAFVVKLKQDSCSNLALIINAVSNITCDSLGYASSYMLGGSTPFTYEWETVPVTNDSVCNFTSSGIYAISVMDSEGCIREASVLINGASYYSDYDLGQYLITNDFRTGFDSYIWLDGLNNGCDPVSGTMSIVLDPLVTFNSAMPAPDFISGDTLKWNFTSLTYDSAHITPQIEVTTSSGAVIGDSVCFTVMIIPVAGDADPANNYKYYCFPVVNGYDPNDKQVYPQGECEEHVVLPGKKMTYTVRFQNTGNAEAINIYILDSLDSDLDLNTVRVVGHSHPLITEVLPENVLKFRFDNIYLPDSTSDEPNSHGYVIFEVDQLTGLPSGTILENTAYIYFDFNPAVVTNTVHNMIGPVSLPCDIVTGVTEQVLGENIKVYPNPATNSITISTETIAGNISLLDLSGRRVMQAKPNGTLTNLDLSQLQNGIYFVKLVTVQGEHVVKVVKQ